MRALAQCASSSSATPKSVRDTAFWSSWDHWRRAAANTSRCLVGCSIGDLGMLYALQAHAPDVGLPAAIAASCVAGISTSMALETVVLRATEDLAWQTALRTATGMSLLSMVSMELAENAVELYVMTDGFAASASCGLDPSAFRQAVPAAMLAGWLTPLPYNYYVRVAAGLEPAKGAQRESQPRFIGPSDRTTAGASTIRSWVPLRPPCVEI